MKNFVALIYHSLGDNPENEYNIELINFKEQMKWLQSEGYTVEGFQKFIKRQTANKWPSRYALLTFDDGYKSFLKAADILNDIGFNATFFITKDWCKNKQNFLSEIEIKELGLTQEIGSHTISHPILTKIPINLIYSELFESKKWIEDLIQSPIHSISAPGGFINSKIIKMAFDIGYKLIGNSNEWWNNVNFTVSSSVINRIAMRRTYSIQTFNRIVKIDKKLFVKRKIRFNLLYLPKFILSAKQIRKIKKTLNFYHKI